MNVKNNDIWANPIIPNTVYIPFLPIVSKYSIIFNIKNAIEFNIPYIINIQCNHPHGNIHNINIAKKHANEYPYIHINYFIPYKLLQVMRNSMILKISSQNIIIQAHQNQNYILLQLHIGQATI